MILYQPSPEADVALGAWWADLAASGDLARLMQPAHRRLGAFLARMQPPTVLLTESDATGCWSALWASPWCAAAILGLWVRADHRRQRRALRAILGGLDALLRVWPLLIVLAEPARARTYARAGVTIGPVIPGLWGEGDCALGWLTREAFEATWRTQPTTQRVLVPICGGKDGGGADAGGGGGSPGVSRDVETAGFSKGEPGNPNDPFSGTTASPRSETELGGGFTSPLGYGPRSITAIEGQEYDPNLSMVMGMPTVAASYPSMGPRAQALAERAAMGIVTGAVMPPGVIGTLGGAALQGGLKGVQPSISDRAAAIAAGRETQGTMGAGPASERAGLAGPSPEGGAGGGGGPGAGPAAQTRAGAPPTVRIPLGTRLASADPALVGLMAAGSPGAADEAKELELRLRLFKLALARAQAEAG
jgi:hypothetical protein